MIAAVVSIFVLALGWAGLVAVPFLLLFEVGYAYTAASTLLQASRRNLALAGQSGSG